MKYFQTKTIFFSVFRLLKGSVYQPDKIIKDNRFTHCLLYVWRIDLYHDNLMTLNQETQYGLRRLLLSDHDHLKAVMDQM